MLERHLESVAHEDGAVEAFLADMAVDLPVPELCWLGLAAPLLRRQERLADIPLVGHRLRRLEAWAITHFMLSTDAFRPGRPEGQPIRYVGYYEPRLAPGLNPLADLRPTDC